MRRTEFRATDEVLLTADTGDALSLYTSGLERQGLTVFSTASAENAAAFVRAGRPPNVLVIVASLRHSDEWRRMDPLLTIASEADIPVVLVTAAVRPDGRNRRAALDRGCAAFVGQPCPPHELSHIVQRVLAGEAPIVSPPLP